MGQKLQKFYAFAVENGGLPAQMRLVMATGLTSQKAEQAEDSPENVAKFQQAVKDIVGKEAPVY